MAVESGGQKEYKVCWVWSWIGQDCHDLSTILAAAHRLIAMCFTPLGHHAPRY